MSTTNIVPNKDYVLVESIDSENVTAGGIYLPENKVDNNASSTGRVVAVGADLTEFKVGDKIVYKMWTAHKYQKLFFVEGKDILARED